MVNYFGKCANLNWILEKWFNYLAKCKTAVDGYK